MNELFRIIPESIGNAELNDELRESLVFAAWCRVAGEKLCEFSKPLKIDGTRLIVAVGDATWQKQLMALSGQLLPQINRANGTSVIKFLEFRIKADMFSKAHPVDSGTEWQQREEKIQIRKEILDAASSIADENLRAQFLATARSIAERGSRIPDIVVNEKLWM